MKKARVCHFTRPSGSAATPPKTCPTVMPRPMIQAKYPVNIKLFGLEYKTTNIDGQMMAKT